MKKGFTLLELLIVVTILAILLALVFGGRLGNNVKQEFTAEVVRKYETTVHNGSINVTTYRVEVQRINNGVKVEEIEVLNNIDSDWDDKQGSATLQANLIPGQTYRFHTIGERRDNYGQLPNIIQATHQTKSVKAEVEYP